MTEILPEASFEIDGFGFGGPDSGVVIEDVDFGEPDIITHDVARPRADGLAFGRDHRGGRTITIEMTVLAEYATPEVDGYPGGYGTSAALTTLGLLSGRWLADDVRSWPQATSALRYRLGGRQRVVYGRPRKLATVSRWATLGRIPVTATFQTIDHLFYDDQEKTNALTFVPPPAGGLTWPITFPWSTVPVAYAPGVIGVLGGVDSWLVSVVYGPIANPSVRWVGGWEVKLNLSLSASELIVVDPRPWSRGIRLNNVTDMAGVLDPFSPRLSEIRLPWGVHEVVLGGQDQTGSSRLLLAWRDAYASP